MSVNLFLILVVMSAIITPIVVLLIPRARRSTVFDALLWVATLLVAFLGGWYAFGMADPNNPLGGISVAGMPILQAAIGALVGAMAVNLPLWLLDRFDHPGEAEDDWDQEEEEEEIGPDEDEPAAEPPQEKQEKMQ